MNTELQKTICEQLSYQSLKCFWIREEDGEEIISYLTIPDFPFLIGRKNAKPILRRMDLTKPITHKGETFTPWMELAKAFGLDGFEIKFESTDWMLHFWAEGEDDSHVWLFFDEWCNFPQWVCDKLSEFHYNWRGIPDDLVNYTDEFDYDVY